MPRRAAQREAGARAGGFYVTHRMLNYFVIKPAPRTQHT